MSPQTAVTWVDFAQKVLVPLLTLVVASVGSMMVGELKSLTSQVQQLQVQLARLETKVEMLQSATGR